VDWKEYKEIEELFNKIPSDFKNIEEFKEFEGKYYEVIISFYKKKQGL
jgi:L-rhamnose isomerase